MVREAAWRVLGQRHFDVQLMGGMALHFGWIAEMKTGEGKTLVSTLPAYLNALDGRGVHMVTVNEYLAARDAEWMGHVYRCLGPRSAHRLGHRRPERKRAAYARDITYGTNNEFGFDYLRDNMARSPRDMVQRGHVFAIVDEVDSILIDEARTPLIISGPADESAQLYYQFASHRPHADRDVDYEVDEEKRTVVRLETGIEKVETAARGRQHLRRRVGQLRAPADQGAARPRSSTADKDYLVADGEVKIVDEFTGRTLQGRRWSDGLHQAVEAKERVGIKEENHTWATVTLQNYFRMYKKLAGMTGTAETEAGEFADTYRLAVVPIPTNKPMVRADQPDLIFKTEEAKFNAVVEDIIDATRRASRCSSARRRWPSPSSCRACSRSRASSTTSSTPSSTPGRPRSSPRPAGCGGVTVATNMAGRGVDIILGGNPEMLAGHELADEGVDLDIDEGAGRAPAAPLADRGACRAEGEEVRSSAGSTSSAASGTRAAGSTTSCAAVRAARATRARAASTCRSKTS